MKVKNKEIALEKDSVLNRKILFVIFIFTLLLYSNSIKNNYALDDNYVTVPKGEVGNTRVAKGIKGIPEIFKTHYVESAEQSFEYRPLPLVTFAIEYQIFGSNPHISHFISILLYAFTCMLLFTILAKLFKNYNLIFPLLITLLFIIHPIHTEVVDNIKCRDELMSFLFGLCALHFFIKSIEIEGQKWQFIALSILFLCLGLLCKRTAIIFIVLIPLTGYFFYDLSPKKIIGFVFIFFIGVIIYAFFKRFMVHHILTEREYVFFENPLYFDHSFATRISLALYSIGYYLKLLIFPYPLCCYYGYNTIPIAAWSSPVVLLAVVFYAIIGIYALRNFLKKTVLAFGILIYLGALFPFANIVTPVVGIIGERFVYFASFGFCIMAAYGILILFKIDITDKSKFKTQNLTLSFKLVLLGVFLVYTCLVISRNFDWKDRLTLYRTDIKHFGNSYNLSYLITTETYPKILRMPNGIEKEALIQEANVYFRKELELMKEGLEKSPTDYITLNNVGLIYNDIFNDPVSAQSFFKQVLKCKPDNVIAKFNLATCYEKRNLSDSAILILEKITVYDSKEIPINEHLIKQYFITRNYLKAIGIKLKLIGKAQNKTQAYIDLGNVCLLNKDTANGIKMFEKAVDQEPYNVGLRNQIVTFLRSSGHVKEAEKINGR